MKIILAADHGGYEMKEAVKGWLFEEGYQVEDVGAAVLNPEDDFVDFGKEAVKKVETPEDRMVLFCRNGFGMEIVANRYIGVRCGLAFDEKAVQKGRIDDDINALSIPSDYIGLEEAKKMIKTFLTEGSSTEEKYKRRVAKLDNLNLW